jgi:hypothetical protein
MPYHYELVFEPPMPEPWNGNPCWVICDHPFTVSFERLNLIRLEKTKEGRQYKRITLDVTHVKGLQTALKAGLGLV